MNTIYKVIWNASLGIWIAVSELAKGHVNTRQQVAIKKSDQQLNHRKANHQFSIMLSNNKKFFLGCLSLIMMNTSMAVQTISTTGTGKGIQTPGASVVDTGGIYTDWLNLNNASHPVSTSQEVFGIAIGTNANAVGNGTTVIGTKSSAGGIGSIILGSLSITDASSSILIGSHSYSNAVGSIGMGRDVYIAGIHGVSMGSTSSVLGSKGIAIGHSALAGGTNSIALGASQGTSSSYTTTGARASGNYAIAIGTNVEASGQDGLAVGSNTVASALNSASFGRAANAAAEKSLALGDAASVIGVRGLAIGASANATHDDSVALGSNSTTTTNATSETFVTQNGLRFEDFQGQVSSSGMQVSVGAVGAERQIKNVAAGKISNISTDAVNGSQLFTTNAMVGAVANSTKALLGGNAALSSTGTLSITDIGGTGATTVHNALIAVKSSADSANTALANNTAAALGGGAAYDANTGVWTAPTYKLTNLSTGVESTVSDIGTAISGLDAAVNTPLTFKDATTGTSIHKLGSEFKFIGDANIAAVVTEGQLALNLNPNLTGLTSIQTTDGTNTSTMTATGTTVTDGTNTTAYGADGLNINDGAVILDSTGLNAGGVTVGATGINANNQMISNVADAQNAGDATNLGQVESLLADVSTGAEEANTALANNTAAALGGGAAYNETTGVWTAPTYTLTNPSTGVESTVSDIGSAISGLDAAVNTPLTFKDATTGTSIHKLGSEFKFIGDANIAAVVTEGQLALNLNPNLTGLTSVQTTDGTNTSTMTATGTTVTDGTNTTVYGADGLNINDGAVILDSTGLNAGGVTVGATGINANNQMISNVADAQNAGDATNLGQVESLLADATTAITNKGFSLQAEDGKNVIRKLGEAIDIIGDNQNISTEIKDDKIAVVLGKDLVLDSINAGGTILDSEGLIVGDTQITQEGIFINGGPSLSTHGIDAGNKTISNLARAVNAGDAVNKEQFDEAIQDITESVGGLTESAVQYDRNEDGSVNKDSITLGGENGTLITNVADGEVELGSKDAINGGQLATVRDNLQGQINDHTSQITELRNVLESEAIGLVKQVNPTDSISVGKNSGGNSINFSGTDGNRVLTGIQSGNINKDSSDAITGAQLNTNYEALAKSLGGNAKFENGEWTGPSYTVGYGENEKTVSSVGDAVSALNEANQTLNHRLDNMGAQFDDAIQSTNDRIDKLTNKANAATAAAIAIASLPQPMEYGNTMMAVGTGVWEGETGFSIGASGVTQERKLFNTKPVHYIWKLATTTNSRGTWGGGASVGIQWK